MINLIRRLLIKFVSKVSPFVGELYSPWTRKKVYAKDYHKFMSSNLPDGTVLCTKTNGELGNLFIPGFYSHAAMYVGEGKVVEAVGKGVVVTDLIDFLLKKDFAVALIPRFANREQMQLAAAMALSQVGKPYDYEFRTSDVEAFYCGELIHWSYSQVTSDMDFVLRDVFGVETAAPDDFPNAEDDWEEVWRTESLLDKSAK